MEEKLNEICSIIPMCYQSVWETFWVLCSKEERTGILSLNTVNSLNTVILSFCNPNKGKEQNRAVILGLSRQIFNDSSQNLPSVQYN